MSIESDLRALLAGHVPLTTLVGTRIALNAVPDGSGMPCVVYSVAHLPVYSTDARLDDRAAIAVQCWAETAAQAEAVAAAVQTAINTAPAANAVRVTDSATGYDAEIGLDVVSINVEWWGGS